MEMHNILLTIRKSILGGMLLTQNIITCKGNRFEVGAGNDLVGEVWMDTKFEYSCVVNKLLVTQVEIFNFF